VVLSLSATRGGGEEDRQWLVVCMGEEENWRRERGSGVGVPARKSSAPFYYSSFLFSFFVQKLY